MRPLFIFGTRPEAIKMCPVIRHMMTRPADFTVRVCVTAQHREMLDEVLSVFNVRPDHDLNVMLPGQTLSQSASRIIAGLEPVLAEEKPDIVLVQGDTTTTFAAALAAFYAGVPVGHVEAGLRTGNLRHPFPEEMNRILTTRLAALHFAPTDWAAANLRAEGVPPDSIFVTGNTSIDAVLHVSRLLESVRGDARGGQATLSQSAQRGADMAACPPRPDHEHLISKARSAAWTYVPVTFAPPNHLPATQQPATSNHPPATSHQQPATRSLLLVTAHRRESFGDGLASICRALLELAARDDVQIVYPVHPNPNVRGPVHQLLGGHPNICLTEPLAYVPFVDLMRRAAILLTDSGGIQEEGPALGKPVLVMRETTERPEAVEAGTARLVGTDPRRIVAEAARLLDDPAAARSMTSAANPYGDGQASARIAEAILGQTATNDCAERMAVSEA